MSEWKIEYCTEDDLTGGCCQDGSKGGPGDAAYLLEAPIVSDS